MKKNLLILATIALSLAACTNDEEYTIEREGAAIEFRTIDEDKTSNSRAPVTTTNTITSFTVTAWWDKTGSSDYGDDDPSEGVYLFNAFNIARGEGSVLWDYSPKRYFPADNKGTVDFFAYSPASSVNLSQGIKDFDGSEIKYTVPTINDAAGNPKNLPQEDFMVAKVLDKNSGTVSLNFQHALSRVTFSARKTNPDITYIVKEVALVNLAAQASLDLQDTKIPQTGSFTYDGSTVIWKSHSTAATTYSVDMGDSPIFLQYNNDPTPTYYSLLGDINGLMVMPQTTTEYAGNGKDAPTGTQFAIKVTYKAYLGNFYYAGSAGSTDDTYAVKYFPVKPAGSAITFEIGRQYNFFLTFGEEAADAIAFDVTVSDWNRNPSYPTTDDFREYLSTYLAELVDGADGSTKDNKISYAELYAFNTLGPINSAITESDLKGLDYLFALRTISFSIGRDVGTPITLSANHQNLTITHGGHGTMVELNTLEYPDSEINIKTTSDNFTITKLTKRADQKVVNAGSYAFTINGVSLAAGDTLQ